MVNGFALPTRAEALERPYLSEQKYVLGITRAAVWR